MLIPRIGVLRRDQMLPGRDLVAAVCGRGDGPSVSFSTKANSLNSHLSAIPKLAKARAKPVGSKLCLAAGREATAVSLLPRDILPLLMSSCASAWSPPSCFCLTNARAQPRSDRVSDTRHYRRHPMGHLAGHPGVGRRHGRGRFLFLPPSTASGSTTRKRPSI